MVLHPSRSTLAVRALVSNASRTPQVHTRLVHNTAACGETTTNTTGGIGGTNGFSAAVSQLAFGSEPGLGAGNACGRCFELTGEKDPYDLSFNGPFKTIIVKATDMCPVQGNEQWCGQTTQNPVNSFGASMQYVVHILIPCVCKSAYSPRFHRSFDLCQDSGAAEAFFTTGHGAFTGSYRETNCKNWAGSDSGNLLWNGACLDGEKARTWPKQGNGCPNKGTKLFLPSPRIFFDSCVL
jgi:hypothetical protein